MNRKHLIMYLKIAKLLAMQSTAKRLQVGALVVKDDRILSIGYNGTPPGWSNECEDETNTTKPEVIHAEMNALFKLARDGEAGKGATMFLTHSPCIECAKAIHLVGITEVHFLEAYREPLGVNYLTEQNIHCLAHTLT